MEKSTELVKITLIAFEGISAFHLSVPCMVFQDIFFDQPPRFDLKICSEKSSPLETSSGFGVVIDRDLSAIKEADIVIVPSWPNDLPEPSERLIEALIEHHGKGKLLVGLCLGSYVLACAGVLDGKRATSHWAFSEQFQQQFLKVNFDPNPLFIEHETIITSAGVAASLDCCLHIVRRLCGSVLANDLARKMVTAPFRTGGQQQYIPAPISVKPLAETSISLVIEHVEQNVHLPHSLDAVAERCAMSKRTFTRQFKATYGCTFGEWLQNKRLVLSQRLLETTKLSVPQVAEKAGFGSDSVFRKHFKSAFHVSPIQWRTTFKQ
ncbi:GlxA family transcriptional regulator [Vibrio genomosp. F10]|uniref:GlxA family transcriptional regulator n=1 Tax=Vibrio genomosp. F10 TaxID=723171 RepID=UPI0002E4EB76|nr:helix-turn-helix domain-containing protein [Vibrio genomosp. F10]OEF10112.1 AraC family transcriptional regulator [Vibrio genomosp. F10 str. 9ZB36]